jgi:hypothetical protein
VCRVNAVMILTVSEQAGSFRDALQGLTDLTPHLYISWSLAGEGRSIREQEVLGRINCLLSFICHGTH